MTPKPVPLRRDPAAEALLGVSPATRRGAPELGFARHAYLLAAVASLAWAGMLFAYTVGYVGGFAGLIRAPMQLAVVCLMAALPALFIFAGAFALRQGARLAAEARWARSLADDLMTPAVLAAAKTGDIASTVRVEVERASAAAVAAHGQLISVREALASESDRLTEAAAQAQHTARVVSDTLARERDAVAALLHGLSDQAAGLAAGVERQSRLVGEASDLTRSQLQEAEATLASGAERLAAASSDAGAAAREAGDGLIRQSERLDVAAAALSERLRFLDARLNDQRGALTGLLHTLDTEQDDVAARLESHRAQMLDVIAEARRGASDLGTASADGAEALRGLIAVAVAEARDLSASVRAERGALQTEAAEARQEAQIELHRALDALARAGEDARRALTAGAREAEAATSERVGAARHEIEQLGELAFAAGQRADAAFQSRLGEARRMIEQTAALVEEAGQRAGQRIDAGLGASRGALGELSATLQDIDGRLARLPEAARHQAEAVRAGVEQSLDALTASARRAAEETQGLDTAFQARIRQSYEALSEAVRLMGRVAGAVDFGRDLAPRRAADAAPPAIAPPLAAPPPIDAPVAAAPLAPVAVAAPALDPFAGLRHGLQPNGRHVPSPTPPLRAAPRPVEPASTSLSAGPADLLLEPEPPSVATAARAEPEPALRPRLKFTPTAADEALKAVFAGPPTGAADLGGDGGAGGRGAGEPDLDAWTWKDLLTSMESAPTDIDALADQMIREIEALGVDAAALLPRARIDDVASALGAGDASAARDAVRRLAPAAIRRLSRRVLTDRALREQVDRYTARYQDLLGSGTGVDGAPHPAADVLASEGGRAYLLLDAAVGDL